MPYACISVEMIDHRGPEFCGRRASGGRCGDAGDGDGRGGAGDKWRGARRRTTTALVVTRRR